MDPKKAAAEWFRSTVFQDEAIQPRAVRNTGRVPSMIRAARSLENGAHQSWQSRDSVFLKQAKLLANYEDDYDFHGNVSFYYPTYQSLTDQQLRGYFSWRTKLRQGDVRKTSLSFAFLYIYELINQAGVTDPMDGYRRLEHFRDVYGQIDGKILSYLGQWLMDYVIYYGLDQALLSGTPQALFDQSAAVFERVQEEDPEEIIRAVHQRSKWLERSKFYAAHREDVDAVTVRVLRRMSSHYAARCKKTLAEQYFGGYKLLPVNLFRAAVFCNPLKRKNYEYAADSQRVYFCKNGLWSVRSRTGFSDSGKKLDALLKTIDSIMRQEFDPRSPVKAELDTKWILQLIQEEVQRLSAQKRASEEKKIAIDYEQLTRIRQDAAITREKLIVEEEMDLPEEPAPPEPEEEPEQTQLSLDGPSDGGGLPLTPAEYRLLQCLLYGGDVGWVQAEGHLLSVLADGINEKLYDTFLDCVLDGTPQLVEDYIDDLKEMVHP